MLYNFESERPNISPQAFDIIIKYLYTGQFDITDKTGADLIDFMIAFGECMLNDLTKFTEDFMFRSQQQFLQDDPVGILQIIYCYKIFARSSRDGNTAAAFHAKCDRKGATIVVVRIANSERIVGGYNPLFWDSDDSSYIGTYVGGSFIFSFTNENGLRRANVAYSNNWRRSVYSSPINGPGFGYGDLYVNYVREPSVWYSVTSCYPTINLPNTMSVDDYEVFQVIKKSLD
ncbi:uncharacterized protein OCT59_004929 [Rhizophagus irregularis]|uniref:uncharacterized protein n=1 Tax=Rhizophagus irregularis TaxID=588596 RepID=UPI003327AF05|nr:hypothetical protein OCT59_004929 [Rhizophagus irregularis]